MSASGPATATPALNWPSGRPKVRALGRDAAGAYVLFNNCYRDYAQVNVQQLAGLLHA
jgi:hypothetical protein